MLRLCVVLACLAATPASAEWIAAGRWSDGQGWRYVQPGTWIVDRDGPDSVALHAEGENHDTRLAIGCRRGDTAAWVEFSRYRGAALAQPVDPMAAPVTAEIGFHLDDLPIGLWMTFSPETQSWRIEDALDTEALYPFGWASRLTILAPEGTELARYRLNGSSAAREALRNACGF
ncbi:MAG: hypothetical protein R3D60_11610 [Paracoccaceae bacterium]